MVKTQALNVHHFDTSETTGVDCNSRMSCDISVPNVFGDIGTLKMCHVTIVHQTCVM